MELPKAYEPKNYEDDIYKRWEASGFFNPDNLKGEPYAIIMPPPNANGALHIGHALFVTLEDIMIRYARMKGKKTLWLPGSDHAGFETQVVFEKKLEKEGRSRFQMTREEFYKECWDFVQSNKHKSEDGLRRLGASCDWSRNVFTLDSEIVKVVYETFKKMYEDGLIYRGCRLSNWCPKHQTGLSDLETKHEERVEPFYYFKYGPFTISTSRPETKFGDKHVVMHPGDERYKKFKHGEKINLEWINGPITTTVIKDEAVDREFGTGVMTITPAHDRVDFEIAERHGLEMELIIDKRGKLLPIAGEFSGMKILDARPKIVEKLKNKGLLVKIDENYRHNVQLCYKCSNLIEPQIVPQWYVAMTKKFRDGRPALRDMALKALDDQEVKIVTERFEKIFRHWMEDIRDWPISRQIWWGIPIPVKYCDNCHAPIVDIDDSVLECPKCSSDSLTKDSDTFDTWFSSGQWPYAALLANDAKKGSKDFETFFPTQVMETGWDILFFWVARMVVLSYYQISKPPFEKIYLHGLVRDKDRQKMSKSKGNVIDPLGVIELYGTDALRFALIFSTAAGNDIPLSEEKIRGMQHFANKLWNIARFIVSNIEESGLSFQTMTEADTKITEQLDETAKKVTDNVEAFRFHEAAQEIYEFVWRYLADVYLEAAKEQLKDEKISVNTKKILLYQLVIVLKLLHPFMPFITEVIWQELRERGLIKNDDLLMISSWPQ
ncbi:MAG: Valyl-tRNA synthetase [Candidatus Magasanikbacteria bacterium GW2011_GWA2_46_17]|uniref:Valine--tRNA ligase n=1 Tax=Candidatus Magasanikbacteria bacterium GW2011_GWA2_46_17 TaxID=1619042 RepID=A0A0G1P3W9_9BACT|nr:MAG: Valyl-tRNA synthetase [Candidatus Magasanikbacteria bacterium GW2011_GWA2_46_17]